MKDFFQRNMPVFIIGLVTIGVFIIIIVTASRNPGTGPKLEQIKNEQFITSTTPVIGLKDSKVILLEFSDFECPACKAFAPVVNSLIEKYKDKVLFAYKNMPLPQHTNAMSAAIAAQAAYEQGKFWEYGDKLFDEQPDFSKEKYIQIAKDLGLDVDKFEKDLERADLAKRVEDDRQQALRIGVDSTPTFILNGQFVKLTTYDDLEKQIISELTKNNITVDTPLETTQSTATEITSVKKSDDSRIIDNKYGVIEIDYIEQGFVPNNVKAVQGQLVRWTNKTKSPIKMQQIISLYDELSTPLTIDAGATFELRLTKDKLWTYKEMNHAHYASIFTVAPEN
jgi:protein-disulfide isomerase